MNAYLLTAGCIALLTGLVHSVLGEILIFSRLRAMHAPEASANGVLSKRSRAIVHATWHALSVFGWGYGVILMWLATPSGAAFITPVLRGAIALPMIFAAALVLAMTKGKHPGWLALLGVALLTLLG